MEAINGLECGDTSLPPIISVWKPVKVSREISRDPAVASNPSDSRHGCHNTLFQDQYNSSVTQWSLYFVWLAGEKEKTVYIVNSVITRQSYHLHMISYSHVAGAGDTYTLNTDKPQQSGQTEQMEKAS